MLDIKIGPENGKTIRVDEMWLRDQCSCLKCVNATGQRIFELKTMPRNIKATKLTYTKNDCVLDVEWNDGHVSQYPIDQIVGSQYEHRPLKVIKDSLMTLWNVPTLLKNRSSLDFGLGELCTSDKVMKDLVTNLIRYGLVFIHNVPANSIMTEMTVRRIFPLMKTLYGEVFTFANIPLHDDITYTQNYIGPHTDHSYFCDAAGLQALHCIEHDGKGGENFFIDGIYCAHELRRQNPKAFDILSTVNLPGEFYDKRINPTEHHRFSSPIIRVEPTTKEIYQIRLNLYDRTVLNTIPQEQVRDYYEAMLAYLDIVNSSEHLWHIKMNLGTVVIFDNWRLLHGREAYTGKRAMTGSFVQRTDFLSKARILGIID